jgi:hypothetical protein
MTRTSKQEERRHKSPRKIKKIITVKTGPKKDKLPKGFKEHLNAVDLKDHMAFIPQIKGM